MKILYRNVVCLLFFVAYLSLASNDIEFGVLFGSEDSQTELALLSAADFATRSQPHTNFKPKVRNVLTSDGFKTTKMVCGMLKSDNGLGAIFGPSIPHIASVIQSLCTNLEVPHFHTSWRPSETYENTTTLINLFPKAELLSKAIAVIVKSLQWKKILVLYENDEGLLRLQDVLKLQNYDDDITTNNILVKRIAPGPNYRPFLKDIQNYTKTFQVILDCKSDNIFEILSQAKELKMLEQYHEYFITSLDAHLVKFQELNTLANITTMRIFDPGDAKMQNEILQQWKMYAYNMQSSVHNFGRDSIDPFSIKTETVLLYDAVNLFAKAVNDLKITQRHIETVPLNCDEPQKPWELGLYLASYIKRVKFEDGITGPMGFDSSGRRTNFSIHVVEVQSGNTTATWTHENPDSVQLVRSQVDLTEQLLKNFQTGTIIVSSQLMKPYLMERKAQDGERLEGNARYEGYSMDLMTVIAADLNFTFRFEISKHGRYGKYDPETGQWTGLIRDIIDREADLAICDLTITHARRSVVDFSNPFMRLGISILYKKPDEQDINMWAFLDPFSVEVWIYTVTLYLTVSIILLFVSRMAPGDWENPHPCEQQPPELENIWDIKNCLWLTLGSIMTQGSDILPKGISSRMATSMWWFFALIMSNSYIANLAAFLTTQRLEPPIDSAEALAKQSKIKYGAMRGGSTMEFFRSSNDSLYSRMWTAMEQSKPSVFENSNDDGVNRVQNTKNRLYAFLMESTQIEYEVATKCDLKQVGNWLDNKGYGIAMPINYPYRSRINGAILRLQEKGVINKLKTKWWTEKRDEPLCPKIDSSDENSSALALANVGGVFLAVGLGVAIATLIAIGEFLWNVRTVSVEEHLTYWEAFKVEFLFALNIWVTQKKTKPQLSSSSSSSTSVNRRAPDDSKSMTNTILHGAGSFLNMNILQRHNPDILTDN